MRTLLALLLAMLAFAGCLDNDEPETTDDSTDETPEEMETRANITTDYSFGPGLGCVGDVVGPSACQTYQAGPGATGTDGYWIPLGPDYVGLPFTSTVDNVRADSDCVTTDAEGGSTTDFSQGEGPCSGIVPAGAEWLFVYSYAEPHQGLTVSFTV